jgi:small subunit ribosomal protein S17
MNPKEERNRRKIRVGTVVADAMDKSIVVRLDRRRKHPLYNKPVKSSSKLYAHDQNNEARVGDLVRLAETRPLSKTKRWRLVEVVEKAK